MNPEHLLDRADLLIDPGTPLGRPRQADLRRAISNAYYAVFHFTLAAIADFVLGKAAPKDDSYARVYRGLDHGDLKNRSNDVRAIGGQVKAFIDAALTLQNDRHEADYNPLFKVTKSDALTKVKLARSAIASFKGASENDRRSCLVALLFKKR
jgi:hypothetical protein